MGTIMWAKGNCEVVQKVGVCRMANNGTRKGTFGEWFGSMLQMGRVGRERSGGPC